ncbi:MAG: DUF4142 domain-containing protein [Opitutaceae bacterium]|nr:DUF4142 domain-containing protein [Opitutaceae bacterium]
MSALCLTSQQRILRRAFHLGVAGFLASSISAVAAPQWRARPVFARSVAFAFAAEPLATDALRPVERTFLEQAAELSRQQIRFARLAVSQASSSDVRSFAQQLAGDHRQISDSIEGLRRKKGSMLEEKEKSPDAVPEGFQELAQKTGADFDREFVRLTAQMQARELTLFEEAMSDAKDNEVRDLVGTYLPMIREHQNRGTELKKTFE